MAQKENNLPTMQETWVQSLGREDPLEKGMATHSSILAWKIPWTEEPGGLESMKSRGARHDRAAKTHSGNALLQSMQKQRDHAHAAERKAAVTGAEPTRSRIRSSPSPRLQEKKPKGASCSPWTRAAHSPMWFLSSLHRSLSNIQAAGDLWKA